MKLEAMPATAPPIGSPFDLRVGVSEKVDEIDIRSAMDSGEWGFIHSFTTGSAVDGPGVRIVAWLAGCQFRCVYCHNPDTWKMNNGIPVTLSRAVEEIQKYRHSLQTMKGGLTISGGEPLLQRRFVIKVFSAVKQRGVHTALDTNGYLGHQLSDEDLASVDLVLLDLKVMTPDLHRRLTGMDNKPIQEFARRLAVIRKPVWVRFVFIPGWTDDLAEVERIAAFAASLRSEEHTSELQSRLP